MSGVSFASAGTGYDPVTAQLSVRHCLISTFFMMIGRHFRILLATF